MLVCLCALGGFELSVVSGVCVPTVRLGFVVGLMLCLGSGMKCVALLLVAVGSGVFCEGMVCCICCLVCRESGLLRLGV